MYIIVAAQSSSTAQYYQDTRIFTKLHKQDGW